MGGVYKGRVGNIMHFGCMVQLQGIAKRCEGLVHISELRREGRVTAVTDVVSRGDEVWVKVRSITGTKISLSMRDMDQQTGEDLNPRPTGNTLRGSSQLTGRGLLLLGCK